MVEISDQEYARYCKWKSEVDSKEEKVEITLIKSDDGDYNVFNPNEYDDSVVCRFLALDPRERISSMGIDKDQAKDLKEKADSMQDIQKLIETEFGKCFFKKVKLLDHSGISVSLLPDVVKIAGWDNSLGGICFIPEKDLAEVQGIKPSEISSDLVEEHFKYYEELMNSYIQNTNHYYAVKYEIPKSLLEESISQKNTLKVLSRYGTEIDSCLYSYMIPEKGQSEVDLLRDECDLGSDLVCFDIYDIDHDKVMTADPTKKLSDFLKVADQAKSATRNR